MFKKISDNTLRYLITLAALFFLSLNIFSFYNNVIARRMTTDDCLWVDTKDSISGEIRIVITQIIPGGNAEEAGLLDGDVLLAINGKKISKSSDAMGILNLYNNEFIEYTILRGNAIIDVNIWVYKFLDIKFLTLWIVGFVFLIVGTLVGISKPKEFTSILFFLLGCSATGLILYANAAPTGFKTNTGSSIINILFFILNISYAAGMFTFPSLFLHFFLTYPIKYEFKRRKLFIIVIYLSFLLTISVYSIAGQNSNFYNLITILIIPVFFMITGIILFRISYKKITDERAKKALNILNKGFIIGAIGILYNLILVITVTKPSFLVNPVYNIPNLLISAIPISFGYSIFKYRILDTEFIVKRSLVFTIATVLIIAVYLISVYMFDYYFKDLLKGNNQLLVITFIFLFTFTFDFVNNKAKEFIDKHLYRERYNFRKSILEFSNELRFINNTESLISKIEDYLEKTIRILNFKFLIFDNSLNEGKSDRLGIILKKIYSVDLHPIELESINARKYNISDNEYSYISGLGFKLFIPIISKNDILGSLNFGIKESGKAFSEEDKDLLQAFASQVAVCLENAKLKEEEINKKRFEEELSIAKKIQAGLLPKNIGVIENLDTAAYSLPATIIGGDFYDIIKLENEKVIFVIADSSDKGIPAALFMSQIQALIHFAATLFKTPEEILKEIINQLNKSVQNYPNLALVLIDVVNKKAFIASLGKTLILQHKARQTTFIDFSNKINDIKSISIDFLSGDILLMLNDGLIDASNNKKESFGSERIKNILDNNANKKAEEIKNKIINNLTDFLGDMPLNDDITFLIIKHN